MTMAKRFFNFIGGEWKDSVTKRTFEKRNPADASEVLGVFPLSGAADVEAACQAAGKAFKAWSSVTPPARGKLLFEAGRLLASKKEELAQVLVRETGKTTKEALGEVNAAIDMAYFMAGEGRRLYGDVTHSELPNRWALTKRCPIGVCGIVTPWNFPMSLISWKVFPALICGNAVVLKPAEDAPETANRIAEILAEAGLPPGVLNIVHGAGEEAGDALVRNANVKMVSFTGSSEVGRRIAAICGERLAKVSLELGGKNAVIVMDDADLDLAVSGIVKGAFTVAGQRCTATSRAIVHRRIYDKFMEKLVAETKRLKVGAGGKDGTDVCPVINRKQLERIAKYAETGKKEGARLVLGGHVLKEGTHAKGFFFEPTIFGEVRPEMTVAKEEIFGPVLAVFRAESLEQAIGLLNDSAYGLSASIFTKDINAALSAVESFETGVCYVNAPTFGSEVHLPFGGMKKSGNGHREVGKAAIEAFSDLKTIYLDYSGVIQNAQFKK